MKPIEAFFRRNHMVRDAEHESRIATECKKADVLPLVAHDLGNSTFRAVWWGFFETATKTEVVHPGWKSYVDKVRAPSSLSPAEALDTQPLLYFIQAEIGGPIKIGVSTDPQARLATLQSGSPFPLRILATAPGGYEYESELHARFTKDRLHGEWFNPTSELLQLIRAAATSNAA